MQLDYADGKLILSVSPRLKDLVAGIPGMNYDHHANLWKAKASWAVAVACRGVLGDALVVTPAANAWAAGQRHRLALAEAIKADQYTLPGLDSRLYGFQSLGVTYLALMERVLLGDEMGTGKTVQSAVALRVLQDLAVEQFGTPGGRDFALPALVVCTLSMKHKWVAELETWGGLKAIAIGDDKRGRERAIAAVAAGEYDVLVCHWEALALHSRLAPYGSIELKEEEKRPKELNAIKWHTVIADEAHKAKDPHSARTRALWAVSDPAIYRWVLTGTPVTGKIEDAWSMLRIVAPHEFPSRSRFLGRYALTGTNTWGGFETYGVDPRHEMEFQAIIRPYILRRTKVQVLPELPPKIVQTVNVRMGMKQAKAYKTMQDDGLFLDDDGNLLIAVDQLTSHGRMSQLAAATPVLEEVEVADPETGELVKKLAVTALDMPSCKVDALFDLIEKSDEPMVVGAESRKLLELVARQIEKRNALKKNANDQWSYGMVTGNQTGLEREVAVQTFQQGLTRILLVTLGAGAEGITLTRSRHLVFLQASYEMVKNLQFADRIHRIGQEADSVLYTYITTLDTVDADRLTASEEKAAIAQQVLKDHERIADV